MALDPLTAIMEVGGKVIDKFFPDADAAAKAKYELFKLQQEGAFKELDQQLSRDLAQVDINKADAASGSNFRGGWRPAAGWVCVLGLFYQFIIVSLLPWLITLATGKVIPALPALDIGTLMGLLSGLLGLGGMRTYERAKGKL